MEEEFIKVEHSYSMKEILQKVADRIDRESELEPGSIAGPPPDSMLLAAAIIDELSDFQVFQGKHFALVTYARRLLP